MMKRVLIILGMGFCIALECHAQNDSRLESAFDEWRRAIHEDFENFRSQIMADYADFVENPWKEFEEQKPQPLPKDDKTPPVVLPKDDKIVAPVAPKPIKIDEIIEPLPVEPQPQPIEPIKEVPVVVESYIECLFYGTRVKVRFDEKRKINLEGVGEDAIAKALRELANECNDNTIIDCLNLRKKLQLCDWAYLKLLEQLSEAAYGVKCNEATLFMAYLYMMSGYRMRLASDGSNIYMLYASRHEIFDVQYFNVDGERFYGTKTLPVKLYICQAKFPNENSLSLIVDKEPLFEANTTQTVSHQSSSDKQMEVNVAANKNRLDFYASYPASRIGDNVVSRWAMYANMPMPKDITNQVYESLRDANKGLSQIETVSHILNWIQTGFVYEYDDKVWGGDRAFFPEESLYYPYCDCEDRSILFTRLVRDLVGLPCILVYYPGHLAAAVCFNEDVPGDYIMIGNRRFVVCDPTYINAPIGETMPGMNNSSAKVVLLE